MIGKLVFRLRGFQLVCMLAVALAGSLTPNRAFAQPQPRIEADGVPGKPFGIGVLTIQLPPRQRMGDADSVSLTERNGRIFYPVYESPPIVRLLRGGNGGGRRLTAYFLFTGDQPLDLTLWTPQPVRFGLTPRGTVDPQRLMSAWWRGFSPRPAGDVYPQFHDYLATTLARRMGLPVAPASSNWLSGSLSGQFTLLTGGEALRADLARQLLLGGATTAQPLDLPLPPAPQFDVTVVEPPAPAGKPDVEPIALHVPEECFYLHTGNFANFLWLRHRLDEWGGDTRSLISEQAVDYGLNKRAQDQLGLKESALSEVLGPAVISDVALVGSDMFLREGAALGVLFEARSSLLLGNEIKGQRSALLSAAKDAKEEKLTLAGKPVSLISTPDNRVRSFYAVDGDYHLVTTSRVLAERFLQTGQKDGQGRSLGASAEFRYARGSMPLDRGDVVFIYLSRAFFENLMGPQYQVEMVRRLRSATEMELVLLAQLLAKGEGHTAGTLDDLIAADVLPAGFGQRSDGSRLEFVDGRLTDSMRGGRGTFVPIPDMPLERISPSENQQYQDFLAGAAKWGVPDPVLVGIRKSAGKKSDLEHVVLDVEAAPLSEQHIQYLNRWLGPPATQRLAPIPGDLVHLDAAVRGGTVSQAGDHFIVFGLQDLLPGPLPADERPLLEALKVVIGQSPLRGYLAAWPQPGLLSMVGGTADLPVDPAGYARLFTGVWRRTFGQFTAMSFHREVLEQVTPQFRLEPVTTPVQLSLRVDDLAGTNLANWVNREGYQRAVKVSDGNARLLDTLQDQFRLPAADCLVAAQSVLDATLTDPLGGKYESSGGAPQTSRWRSSRLSGAAPANYQFPAIVWIRGLDAHGWFNQGRLVLHAELEMPSYGTAGKAAAGERRAERRFESGPYDPASAAGASAGFSSAGFSSACSVPAVNSASLR